MRWIYSGKTSENTGDCALLYSIWAGKQARLHVFTHTNASFNRTLDCCWCCTESPIFARTKVTFSPLPWHRFLQEHLPEQWPLLAFVSSISLPTIEICNARGLITSWETAPPPMRLFEQENQPLRADIVPNSKMERPVCHLCFTISVQIKSSENSCKIPMVVSPSYHGFHLCYLGVSRHLRRGTSSRVVGRRAFGRFWDGQRRSMWDGFTHRLDLPNCVFWDRLPTSKLAKIGIMLVRIVQLPRKVKCILKSVTLWAHFICGKFNPVTKYQMRWGWIW